MATIAELHFDVIIIGAGPAGCACALALKDSDLRVALIDKSTFPRDKVCGDVIPGPAIKALNQLIPGHFSFFKDFIPKQNIYSSRVVNRRSKELNISWKLETFNAKRQDFDNALFQLVKQDTSTAIFENHHIDKIEILNQKAVVTTSDQKLVGRIIVGCDGAHSRVAKELANQKVNRKHYAGAVRRYYQNIKAIDPGTNEFFLSKKYKKGYFWLFPVGDNTWNVGFGMHSSVVAKQNINLKKALIEVIEETPELKSRFKDAQPMEQITGFGLPLGTQKPPLSGDNFLLCGDAASLINPISGSGIDNAIISGVLAAEHIIIHKNTAHFDRLINAEYDREVFRKLGSELKKAKRLWKLFNTFPQVFDLIFFFWGKKKNT